MDKKISEYRNKIDALDTKLIDILAKRDNLSKKIGKSKKHINMPIFQQTREKEAITSRTNQAKKNSLNEKFIKSIFQLIFKHSRSIQKKAQDQ